MSAGQPTLNPEEVKQANDAVKQLSNDDFGVRRQAKQTLIKLGRPAIEPLESGLQAEDAETRARCMEILVALRGSGFLGVQMSEIIDDVDRDGIPDNNNNDTMGVRADGIASHVQYARYGIEKPLPAEGAGLQSGDRLLAVNEKPIYGTKDLRREVVCIGPGRPAVITVERDGKRLRFPLRLTRNPLPVMPQALNMPVEIDDDGNIKAPTPDRPPVDLEKEVEDEPAPAQEKKQSSLRVNLAPAFAEMTGTQPQTNFAIVVTKMLVRNGETGIIGGLKEENVTIDY